MNTRLRDDSQAGRFRASKKPRDVSAFPKALERCPACGNEETEHVRGREYRCPCGKVFDAPKPAKVDKSILPDESANGNGKHDDSHDALRCMSAETKAAIVETPPVVYLAFHAEDVDAIQSLKLDAELSSESNDVRGKYVYILASLTDGYAIGEASEQAAYAMRHGACAVKIVKPEWTFHASKRKTIHQWLSAGPSAADAREELEWEVENADVWTPEPEPKPEPRVDPTEPKERIVFTNYAKESVPVDIKDPQGKTQVVRVPLLSDEIHRSHVEIAGDQPYSVGGVLFIPGPDFEPIYLDSATKLFAFYDDVAAVRWAKSGEVISESRWYEHIRKYARKFDAIETRPHFPPLPNVFYIQPEIPSKGNGAFNKLMSMFCPQDPLDGELLKAMVLTWFAGLPPGKRPAFVITGPEEDDEMGRGVGKSTAPQLLAEELLNGFIDASKTDDIEALKTRLLSNDQGRQRVAIVDNIKTHRFSNAGLEGLITSPTISGRGLYVGEAKRPNLLNFVLTVNGASLSKDMAQRCAVIRLGRPVFTPGWEEGVRTFIHEHLWEIIADVRDLLAAPSKIVKTKTRWSMWERDVLGKIGVVEGSVVVDALQKLIIDRQSAVDNDNDERTNVIEAIKEKLAPRLDSIQRLHMC